MCLQVSLGWTTQPLTCPAPLGVWTVSHAWAGHCWGAARRLQAVWRQSLWGRSWSTIWEWRKQIWDNKLKATKVLRATQIWSSNKASLSFRIDVASWVWFLHGFNLMMSNSNILIMHYDIICTSSAWGLVVFKVVRFSLSAFESLPWFRKPISGMFDQQVVGFGLGCPSSIIQKLVEWTWAMLELTNFTPEKVTCCKLYKPRYIRHMVHKPIETSMSTK